MMAFGKIGCAAAAAILCIGAPASAQTRTETHQGTGRSDAEAIAAAKRGAQDMVGRINAQTIRALHTIVGYGDPNCEPPRYGEVRTCYVDVYIRETSKY